MTDRDPIDERFDLARQLLRTLVATYAERIANADAASVDRLQAEQVRYGHELGAVYHASPAELDRIIRDYPSLIAEVRGATTPRE